MKKYVFIIISLVILAGCKKDKDFLTNTPTSILTSDQVYASSELAYSVLADLYNNYVDQQTITNWPEFTNFDEAFPSEAGQFWRAKQTDYPVDWWSMWNYDYIRNINLFIQNCKASTAIVAEDKARFIGEARFLRAANYFELVKRMGGVPIITEPMTYNFSGDPTYLRHARAKESEVYDFVIAELDTIKAMLPNDATIQDRATKASCLAMQSRAALYAASIAQYGANTPGVILPGGEVGIPASKATAYYQKALAAAQEIINSNKYSLYTKKSADNLAENFAATFYDKSNNPEVIFAQNFKLKSGKVEGWTLNNQPRAIAEEQQGGRVNPSLNLALQYEKLDNSYAGFVTNAGSDYAYYTNPLDIFTGRDARLAGTFILPGSQFKGQNVDIWAGYMLGDGSIITGDNFGANKILPGQTIAQQAVGFSGPIDGLEFSAQTGFYVRKFMDPTVGSGQIGTQSDVWWVRYRYAEVLLNAAEAAFQLGQLDVAAGYMSQVRARAGLLTPLIAKDMSFDRIVHERRVELAFEGHELFDNKRWRIADKVWNGAQITYSDIVSNMGKSDKPNTMIYGMWPYKIYNKGNVNDGKWIFKVVKPSNVTAAHRFSLGNYYSKIDDNVLSNNPLLVKNPNQ
jgi:hypothetical protein